MNNNYKPNHIKYYEGAELVRIHVVSRPGSKAFDGIFFFRSDEPDQVNLMAYRPTTQKFLAFNVTGGISFEEMEIAIEKLIKDACVSLVPN